LPQTGLEDTGKQTVHQHRWS